MRSFGRSIWLSRTELRPQQHVFSGYIPQSRHICLYRTGTQQTDVVRSGCRECFPSVLVQSFRFALGVRNSLDLIRWSTGGCGLLAYVQVLREHGVDGAEVDRIFAGVDMDESGSLHYMEFLAATIEARGYIEVCGYIVVVFCFSGVSISCGVFTCGTLLRFFVVMSFVFGLSYALSNKTGCVFHVISTPGMLLAKVHPK